jgi:hypothetical protein
MMPRYLSLLLFIVIFSGISNTTAQESTQEKEQDYITVTTLQAADHVDFEAWKAVEEEFFNKVTSKIDLIKSHEFLVSYFSPLLSEIKVINMIGNWQDIALINEKRLELIESAWPDEEERNAFFELQNSFYKTRHSDEIYLASEFMKKLDREEGQNVPFVFMVRKNILSDYEDENSFENYQRYVQEVLYKNSKVLAYYPFRHFWGADSREFIELFVFDTFSDVELAKYETNALMNQLIEDEEGRKDFMASIYSAIESQKTSFYKNVPSLSK